MTKADIEVMLQNLAATSRYLQDTGRLIREAAEHIVTVSDHLQAVTAHIDNAVTAGLSHLHGEDEQ